MNFRTILIVGVVSLLIVLIVGVLYFNNLSSKKDVLSSMNLPSSEELSTCAHFSTEQEVTNCVGEKYHNVKLTSEFITCQSFLDTKNYEKLYSCIFEHASDCEEFSVDLKNFCYYRKGINGDETSCGKITSDIQKITAQKDSCYYLLAIKENSSALCENIQKSPSREADNRNYYYERCFSALAKTLVDENLCKKIVTISKRSFCFSDVAHEKNSSVICDLIIGNDTKDSFYYDQCLEGFTQKIGLSICEKMRGGDNVINTCYNNNILNGITNDTSVCEKFKISGDLGVPEKNSCYYYFAQKLHDCSLCSKMQPSPYGPQVEDSGRILGCKSVCK